MCIQFMNKTICEQRAVPLVINYSFIHPFSYVFNKHLLNANYVQIRHCLCPRNVLVCVLLKLMF